MAEFHRGRIAAMFAADAYFQLRTRLPPAFDSDSHQFAHAVAIDRGKRILLQNPLRKIGGQNFVHIVAGEAKRGLREIVGAEREELGLFGDFISYEASAW